MKKQQLILVVLLLIVFLCVWIYISLHQSKYGLTVTQYSLTAEVAQEIRMVQLSDLHGMLFGEGNKELVEAVRAQVPDIIAMTGDMFSMDADKDQVNDVCQLVRLLCEICPVYYALGNHEIAYMGAHSDDVLTLLEESGAIILEQTYSDILIGDQTIRIGGCYGYLLSRKYRDDTEQDFLDEFLNTDSVTILLAHMPEGLLDYNCIDAWDVDLVLSGHTHGGQVRLPLIGGLYDPEVGWFPEYEKGVFQRERSAVVVSAGLGSSTEIPRFCNRPEIVVVDLLPDDALKQ